VTETAASEAAVSQTSVGRAPAKASWAPGLRRRPGEVACAALAALIVPAVAHAFVAFKEAPLRFFDSCRLNHVRARLGPDAVTHHYWVMGTCGTVAVRGEMAFSGGRFDESFEVGTQGFVRSRGLCSDDPWTRPADCGDTAVRYEGLSGVDVEGPNVKAPISLNVPGAMAEFQRALAVAERPQPPNPPAQVEVTHALGTRKVRVAWLAPDESGDRPFLDFLLQARPRAAAGAAWTSVGTVPRGTTTSYAVSRELPAAGTAILSWDVRVCAATRLAATCSEPQAPRSVAGNAILAGVGRSATDPAGDTAASVGRTRPSAPAGPAQSTCERAAAARDRNSPAASALAAKCVAEGGTLPPPAGVDLAALAARGEEIAAADPLVLELRASLPTGSQQRGFDIGLGASAGHTEWGPGKQRTLDSLPPAEQEGFRAAISIVLDRNRHAELAGVGSAIAEGDGEVAAERRREADARFTLGFDIATGIFGDPAQGARGNTATGPGSLGIRNGLGPAAQRGFDAAVALHLARRY
jgi:hypothetical protein